MNNKISIHQSINKTLLHRWLTILNIPKYAVKIEYHLNNAIEFTKTKEIVTIHKMHNIDN